LAKISLPRANFFGSRQRNFKNHFSTSNFFFLSSTYTCTKLMLEFGTILTLFTIFNNFTSF
jgi:enoyl-[acyl-carrier-protein] reductase (NADH)